MVLLMHWPRVYSTHLVLVGLYEEPEKPDSPNEYNKQFLGGPADVDIEALKTENEELKRKVEELSLRIDELTANTQEQVAEAPAN